MIALVLGDAACVHDDAGEALDLLASLGIEPDAVAATNNMIIDWPGRLDYAFSLHPRPCPHWPGIEDALSRRLKAGRNRPEVWAHKHDRGVDKATGDWAGSTGLLAVKGLLEERFTRIILAGVPLSAAGAHYYDAAPWKSAASFQRGWLRNLEAISPYCRSMSGWTKEILGAPTTSWLADQPPADGRAT